MSELIRVVIADDHPLVRRGTREVLDDDGAFEIVGEASDGEELLALAEALSPDVALVDITMPGMNGIEALLALRRRAPGVATLMLTVHDDAEIVWEAIQAGAAGFLVKDVPGHELADAVRAVASGATILDRSMTQKLFGKVRSGGLTGDLQAPLTGREFDVLRHVARGLSNKTIAVHLDLSARTIEAHVGAILRKLHADNRTQAVAIAVRRGIVEITDDD